MEFTAFQMDKFFKTNQELFCQPDVSEEDLYVKSHPATSVFRQRSSDFMTSLVRVSVLMMLKSSNMGS